MAQDWNTVNHGRNYENANIPTAKFWKVRSFQEAKKGHR